MPALPLSEEQKQDASRLKNAWEAFKLVTPGASQEKLAFECGWKTQGTVSQYMRGQIPLNLPALIKFCKALNLKPRDISPTLAEQLVTQSNTAPSSDIEELSNVVTRLTTTGQMQITEVQAMVAMFKAREGTPKI